MARKDLKFSIRIDSTLAETINERAVSLARATGEPVEKMRSAAVRDLVRLGASKLEKADEEGWTSGFTEAWSVTFREMVSCLSALQSALLAVEPAKVVEGLKKIAGK